MSIPKASLSVTEILIAVMMLGIGGTLLVPAWKQFSQEADLMRCRGNLHDIGQAAYLFAADHDGQFPGGPFPGGPFTEWGSFIAERSFGFLLAQRDGGIGPADYIGGPRSLYCPSSRPELFELPGYKRPEEINENNPIVRMGYMWIYYAIDAPGLRSNATVNGNPHRVLVFDFPEPGTAGLGSAFTLSPHPPVINVLHVGGHVNAVSSEEARNQPSRDSLYDWLTDQSRNAHHNTFAGGKP